MFGFERLDLKVGFGGFEPVGFDLSEEGRLI